MLFSCLPLGCVQGTAAGVGQESQQHTTTPTSADQESQQQGSWIGELNITFMNHPGGGGLADDGLLAGAAISNWGDDPNGQAWGSNAGHVQAGNSVVMTVTTGGTTGGQDAAATGTTTARQTPSVSQQQIPTQSPETSLAASIPVALWGGMADAAATAAQRGNATSDKTSANTQRWLQTLTEKLQDPTFVKSLNDLLGLDGAVSSQDAPEGQPGA